MSKLLVIFAVVSSCMPKPPSVPVEETEYAEAWEKIALAWEADETLPDVPDSCDSIEISIISDEDAKKYDGPGPGGGGYLTANIAVAITNADSNASSIRYSLMHEMTHWLALCTGLYTSGDGVADRKHADERLWSAEGVVMRAWNAPADL